MIAATTWSATDGSQNVHGERCDPRRGRPDGLAELVEDAKARAEADVRSGGEFESIEDSWPEEVVSVEALAVEPYPDLE
jgi:hypothetical protein